MGLSFLSPPRGGGNFIIYTPELLCYIVKLRIIMWFESRIGEKNKKMDFFIHH